MSRGKLTDRPSNAPGYTMTGAPDIHLALALTER